MADWPEGAVDLVVTSPPYWRAVEYGQGAGPWCSYDAYLADMQRVWRQCARVLRPNGKLCVNAPLLPIPKSVVAQHTRHLKNIAADMERTILAGTDLARYGLFIWQKQTSKMMFGSYPHPGNIIENNTIEFINVYVKPGRPPKFTAAAKAANRLTRTEWLDLAQQVWFMYPEDVRRAAGHPAPFPEKLPARLIRLYTYAGELVLDPFAGTGTTCAVAKRMGRNYLGIDINPAYAQLAGQRARKAAPPPPPLFVGRPKYPGKAELRTLAAAESGTVGRQAEPKHKRKTFGRKSATKTDNQPVPG